MADLSPLTAEELLEELADVDRILADALAGDGFTYFGIAVKAGALMLQRDDLKKDLAEARERLASVRPLADEILIHSVTFGYDSGNSAVEALARRVLAILDQQEKIRINSL